MEKIYNNGPITPSRARAAKILEAIISQISKEEEITPKRVECILQAIFGQIANDIRSGTLNGTHIMHLGKFLVKPYNQGRYFDQHESLRSQEKQESNGSNS